MRDKGVKPTEPKPGIYEHFKDGSRYEVIDLGINEADGDGDQWYVIYHKLGEAGLRVGDIQVRPYEKFVEPKFIDGKTVERYKKVEDE